MKKVLVLTAVAVAFAGIRTMAQPVVSKVLPKFELGLKAGADFNQLRIVESGYSAGFSAGAFAGFTKKKSGLRVEALVSSAKYTFSGTSINPAFSNMYLDIPVLYEHRLVKILWLQAGPQFRSLLSVSENPAYTGASDPKSNFSSFSIGGLLGLEAQLPAHLVAGARYIYTFNAYSGPTTFATGYGGAGVPASLTIQIYAGYRFL